MTILNSNYLATNTFFSKLVSYIVMIIIMCLFAGCSKYKKLTIEDDRLLNNVYVDDFLRKYIHQVCLKDYKSFILKIENNQDALVLILYPILQKSDSLLSLPIGFVEYQDKIIFVMNSYSHRIPIDYSSKTIILFKEYCRSKPEYEENHQKLPKWSLLIKENCYEINYKYKIPQYIKGIKYKPPIIAPDTLVQPDLNPPVQRSE